MLRGLCSSWEFARWLRCHAIGCACLVHTRILVSAIQVLSLIRFSLVTSQSAGYASLDHVLLDFFSVVTLALLIQVFMTESECYRLSIFTRLSTSASSAGSVRRNQALGKEPHSKGRPCLLGKFRSMNRGAVRHSNAVLTYARNYWRKASNLSR